MYNLKRTLEKKENQLEMHQEDANILKELHDRGIIDRDGNYIGD